MRVHVVRVCALLIATLGVVAGLLPVEHLSAVPTARRSRTRSPAGAPAPQRLFGPFGGQTFSTPTSSWPEPQFATPPGPSCYSIPPTFAVDFSGPNSNDVTAAAAARFPQIFFAYGAAAGVAPAGLAPISRVTVTVTTSDAALRFGINESYSLTVWGGAAAITAPTAFGAVWGLETLSQRVARKFSTSPAGAVNASWYELCDGNVTDAPRFPYRGMLIDTSRHFITVPAIKEVISMLSYLKMNALHWHMTDTQSWPLYIPARPEITNVSAFSPLHVFYPEDVRDVVQYGRERGVVVFPEVDLPAHGSILTNVYPGMGCWMPEGYATLFNPLYPDLWQILRDIYAAVDALFPVDYPIHFGGDEVDRNAWAQCTNVTAWANQSHGKYQPSDITAWFERTLFEMVSGPPPGGLNRTVMAWEDVGAGLIDGNWSGVAEKLVLQQWDGQPGVWPWDTCVPLQQNGSVIIAGPFHIADTPANNYVDLWNITCLTPRAQQQIAGPELMVRVC